LLTVDDAFVDNVNAVAEDTPSTCLYPESEVLGVIPVLAHNACPHVSPSVDETVAALEFTVVERPAIVPIPATTSFPPVSLPVAAALIVNCVSLTRDATVVPAGMLALLKMVNPTMTPLVEVQLTVVLPDVRLIPVTRIGVPALAMPPPPPPPPYPQVASAVWFVAVPVALAVSRNVVAFTIEATVFSAALEAGLEMVGQFAIPIPTTNPAVDVQV
jgi:hypothetical protein